MLSATGNLSEYRHTAFQVNFTRHKKLDPFFRVVCNEKALTMMMAIIIEIGLEIFRCKL